MPTSWKRLYLSQDIPLINPGSSKLSAVLPVGTFDDLGFAPASLLPWKGTSQTTMQQNGLAAVLHQDDFFTSFSTRPLSQQTVAAGTWSFAIAATEGSANAKSFFVLSLYGYRPSGSTVTGYIYDSDTPLGNEWGTIERSRGATFSGASLSVLSGDILCLEVWRHALQLVASSYTQTLYMDGTIDAIVDVATTDAASWIEAPQEIGFSPRLRTVNIA